MKRSLVGVIVLFGMSGTASAQVACPDPMPPSPSAPQVLACLREIGELTARVDALDKVPAGSSIPEGAVVAFVGPCPTKGWQPYAEGSGKMIVGANAKFELGTPGGREDVALVTDNTPPHTHEFAGTTVPLFGYADAPGLYSIAAGHATISLGGSYTPAGTVMEFGPGKPFSIMPPYIALNLCRKLGA